MKSLRPDPEGWESSTSTVIVIPHRCPGVEIGRCYSLSDQETVGAPYLAKRDVGGMPNCSRLTGRDRRRAEHISTRQAWLLSFIAPTSRYARYGAPTVRRRRNVFRPSEAQWICGLFPGLSPLGFILSVGRPCANSGQAVGTSDSASLNLDERILLLCGCCWLRTRCGSRRT